MHLIFVLMYYFRFIVRIESVCFFIEIRFRFEFASKPNLKRISESLISKILVV
jgi:hypothetical protein